MWRTRAAEQLARLRETAARLREVAGELGGAHAEGLAAALERDWRGRWLAERGVERAARLVAALARAILRERFGARGDDDDDALIALCARRALSAQLTARLAAWIELAAALASGLRDPDPAELAEALARAPDDLDDARLALAEVLASAG